MRKLLYIVSRTLLLVMLATACAPDSRSADGRLTVFTSIYPMYDFAVNIGGERALVNSFVPMSSEAHDWEPAPQDITELERADVFIYNGAGMEHWADTVLASLQSKELVVVDASAQVPLLETSGEGDESHDNGYEHGHGLYDPHVWLGISNAKLQTQAIAEAMVAADPEHADYYMENLRRYHGELDALDAEYRERLASVTGGTIVVAHSAYGYLCREYGLHQVSVRGFSPDQEPDPSSLARVVDFCRENNVKVIFFESAADPGIANAIAAETGASVEILTPIESLSQSELDSGETYLSLMRRNLDVLVKALL